MLLQMTNAAMEAIERGYVPDLAVRYAIRGLLKQRLQSEGHGSREDQQRRFESFIKQSCNDALAPVPEKANEQHYELPAEFFSQVLGKHFKYSCCRWPDGTVDLDQAEQLALETTCQRAEIEDGMAILELGCGWGSLSLWIAENFPHCQITAVSNSAVQRQFIEKQVELRELKNVSVLTADMNDFQISQQFDRVVSIEMFEHMRNHCELLRRISGWLLPAGKLFVHIFCHRQFAYPFQTDGSANWMGRHFFTGGIMPSDNLLLRYQDDLSLANQWRWNGKHYEKTCRAWLDKLDHNRDTIMPLMVATYRTENATRWLNRWRLFFLACAELFAFRDGNEWWVSHYLFENRR